MWVYIGALGVLFLVGVLHNKDRIAFWGLLRERLCPSLTPYIPAATNR